MDKWSHLYSFQCKKTLYQKAAKKSKYKHKALAEQCAHTVAVCLFYFSFMFSGTQSFQIQKVNTIHYSASLFTTFCTHLQDFWTLVQVCLGSRGHQCRHSHCSIRWSQLQSPAPQTRRRGCRHLHTVRHLLFPWRPASVRRNERGSELLLSCGLSLSYKRERYYPRDNTQAAQDMTGSQILHSEQTAQRQVREIISHPEVEKY